MLDGWLRCTTHCPGLRIKENKEVYEGEVTELTPEETENQMGGYGRVISHVVIGLKTVKGSKQLRLDPTIYDSLQKERVQVRCPRLSRQAPPSQHLQTACCLLAET